MGFPSVYVQVRQLGAWKLHLYNSIAVIGVIYIHPNFAKSAHVLEEFLNFVVMTVLFIFVLLLGLLSACSEFRACPE